MLKSGSKVLTYVIGFFPGLLLVAVYVVRRVLRTPLSLFIDCVSVMLLTDSHRLETLSSPLIQIRLDDDKERARRRSDWLKRGEYVGSGVAD